MGEMSPWHWAIVIGIAIVLFGARRLPEAARSLGRSARILKAEMATLHDDGTQRPPAEGAPAAAPNPGAPNSGAPNSGARDGDARDGGEAARPSVPTATTHG